MSKPQKKDMSTKVLATRIPVEKKDQLQSVAKARGKTINSLLAEFIDKELEAVNDQKKLPKITIAKPEFYDNKFSGVSSISELKQLQRSDCQTNVKGGPNTIRIVLGALGLFGVVWAFYHSLDNE
jgi:hypothetical protein